MTSSTAPLAVVVGNPKRASRTLEVAEAVAQAAAEAVGLGRDVERLTIDLAEYGSELLDWSSRTIEGLVAGLGASRLVVVASPTYKATYSGLLKVFLDRFSQTGLSGVVAVPVMVGAGARHALATEVHLRPLLVEIGATVPTRGLYVTEDRIADLPQVIADWLTEAGPQLRAACAT